MSVLTYFGYPHAQEDDAEQAVRAALALVDAVANIRTDLDAGEPSRGAQTGWRKLYLGVIRRGRHTKNQVYLKGKSSVRQSLLGGHLAFGVN